MLVFETFNQGQAVVVFFNINRITRKIMCLAIAI